MSAPRRLLWCVVIALVSAWVAQAAVDDPWWAPDAERTFPAALSYANASGVVTTLNATGSMRTHKHPFFASRGTNGRACVTCHQPADAMSLSVDTIKKRWADTSGKDPLFAAVDGSDCPSLPQDSADSHALLLERGLVRVARPWPPRDRDGRPIEPQFAIEVVRDPTGCNRDPVYGLTSSQPSVSVYRRPRPATNVKYLLAAGFPFEPKMGLPLPTDPETGQLISGNLLADARAPTLPAQVRDAMRTHLEIKGALDESAVATITRFLGQLYTAQSAHVVGGSLTEGGAEGGPQALMSGRPGELQYSGAPIWQEFLQWRSEGTVQKGSEQQAFRESVARGAELFSKRTFLIDGSAGVTNMGFGNPVRNSCAFCHNMQRTGLDVAPGQVDIGTVNAPHAVPWSRMPLFKLTCDARFPAHPHLGRVIYTQDPGYALTTGRCVDIGKITAQSMRGLAARAPYFSNGSASTLREVVDFYDRRYRIGLTEQDKQDLTNLMSVL